MKTASIAARFALPPALALAAVLPSGTFAQQSTTVSERPQVYALVSAVGDTMSYVRQRRQVGTHMPPYTRQTIKIPDDALNGAVLRGLDRVVAEIDPDAKRVFLRLNPVELDNVLPQYREQVAIGKLKAALEGYPDRKNWDRILIVTPVYMNSAYRGMGTKLQGLGIFVQPLDVPGRAKTEIAGFESAGFEMEEDTMSPNGNRVRSRTYVAPFFYTRTWVLDAKTLDVIETEARHDFLKLSDPEAPEVDVAKSIPEAQLAERFEKFVERASARALREAVGTVTVGEPKRVPGSTGQSPSPAPAPEPAK